MTPVVTARVLIPLPNVSEEAVKITDFFSVSPPSARHFRILTVLGRLSEEVNLISCFELLAELVIFHLTDHPFYLKELKFGCDSFPIVKDFFDMISDDINDVIF